MIERRGWIESPAYDLPLIALAPMLGLVIAVVALTLGEATLLDAFFIEANFFLLGMPHYLSTFTFYLDDDNGRYYAKRKMAFYLGPVVVVLLLTAAMALRLSHPLAAFVALWNVFHVARQSSGILSLYRHNAAGNNALEKIPANVALLASSGGMFLMHVDRYLSLASMLGAWIQPVASIGGPALLAVGAIAAVVLIIRMRRRPTAAPEWIFLAASVALFTPYLLLQSFVLATTAILAGHYLQYLGLIWLMNHRKYTERRGSWRQRFLATASASASTMLILIVALAAVPFAADRLIHLNQWNALHTWLFNATVLLHFYCDGFFWAFRDPHVRRTLAPYLLSRASADRGSLPSVAAARAS